MLVRAMDSFQVAKREHKEKVKGQYLDKTGKDGAKTYFRASEMGNADRKIIYSFFAHQLPKQPRSAKNLRQLENGDYVHERYQKAWEEMGALISIEERLSSKDDEYLSQFPWEYGGHYDGLLDVNILRAHALGLVKIESVYNEETEEWELLVELDEAYANSIGIFDEEGNIAEDYEPLTMVADIKTMNPWGFKKIKNEGDVSAIGGYIDQIMFYMYMLNTPYGSIFIESKDNNDVVEVQVLWKDLHEDVEYTWDENIHGKQSEDIVRVMVTSERFFGSDTVEGLIPRISRLWELKEALEKADKEGDTETIAKLMPPRCADKPDAFPCSWGHRTGNVQYCEFFEHCWNKQHQGNAVRAYEPCPPEAIWEFEVDGGETIKIDSRKVPQGVDYNGFITLVKMGALDYMKFLVEDAEEPREVEDPGEYEKSAVNADNLFNESGELNLFATNDDIPTEATEYITEKGEKAIDCLNCGKQITYQKLANGGTKKCPFCKHTNRVVR